MLSEETKNHLYEVIHDQLGDALRNSLEDERVSQLLGEEAVLYLKQQATDGTLDVDIDGFVNRWTEEFLAELDNYVEHPPKGKYWEARQAKEES